MATATATATATAAGLSPSPPPKPPPQLTIADLSLPPISRRSLSLPRICLTPISMSDSGCCTSCAVRVKSGQIRQPEALGISAELKSKGYALLCVGYPSSDIDVETQDEDEVYWLQFGRYFARGPIERDDYALELAMGDE